MKPRPLHLFAPSLTILFGLSSAYATVKDNNTNALNLGTSWVGGTAPGSGDIATWDGTVTGANSSALGGNVSWQGISVTNPGGAITITHAAGNILTLGSSGIDMSAATQNLTLLSSANIAGNVAIGANQTWNVASGRTLQLFSNSNTQNQRLTGSGNIEITGGGIVRVLTGDAGSTTFTAGNGNDTFSGNWTVTTGSLRGLRNGTHAWGTGSIILNGGTIGQEQGNWTWTNNITLNTSTTSTFDDFNASGTTRALKLQGVISGSGNVNFNDSSNRMDANNGFILTGTNTMSGTVTVGANGNLRVGGVTGNDSSTAAGTGGTLGTASVNLSAATSTLTFSRSDAHTVANAISGTGAVNVGGSVSGAGTQVLTLSGTNFYTGVTTVGAGRLNLTGSLTSATTVSANALISGTGSTTGTLTMNANSSIALNGGGTTTSLTSNGVNFAGATVARFLTAPVATSTYDVVTYGAGGVTNFANLSAFAHGTLTNDTGASKITFTADGAQSRTWDGGTGAWVNGGATDLWQEGDQDFYDLDNATFAEPGAAATVSITSPLAVGSITLTNTANAYTFDGAGTIGGTGGLTKTGAGAVTFSNNGHNYTGNVTISGGTVNTGTTQGGGTNGYLGAINGSRTITIQNSGTVVNFNANNQFGGGGKTAATIPSVVIDGATLNSTRFNIIGNVTLANGATLSQSSTDSGSYDGYEFIGGMVTVSGSGASTISTGNASENHLAGGRTTTFSVANTTGDAAADLIVSAGLRNGSGDYSGAGAIEKTGAGTMALTGTNTYTGTTTVTGGALLVNGSNTGTGAVSVASGATLGGTGTLAANVTINGVLAPGASIESLGVGNVSFTTGSTFAFELDSSSLNGDLLDSTGSLDIASGSILTLTELASGTLANGSKLTLISYMGGWTSGELFTYLGNPLADGSTFFLGSNEWKFDYNDTTGGGNFAGDQTGATSFVTMTVVPEPAAALLGGLGTLLLLRRRRD